MAPEPSVPVAKMSFASVDTVSYYRKDILCWLPQLMWSSHFVDYFCPHCNSKDTTTKGSPDVWRAYAGVKNVIHALGQRWICKNDKCGKQWRSWDRDFLSKLPLFIQLAFPVYFTHRSGIDLDVLSLIRPMQDGGMSMEKIKNAFRELQSAEHQKKEASYYNLCRHSKEKHAKDIKHKSQLTRAEIIEPPLPPEFSKFEDKSGYNGYSPEGNSPDTLA